MSADELDSEIAAGVMFWGYQEGDALVGVMGFQPVSDVDLKRPCSSSRIGTFLSGRLRRQWCWLIRRMTKRWTGWIK